MGAVEMHIVINAEMLHNKGQDGFDTSQLEGAPQHRTSPLLFMHTLCPACAGNYTEEVSDAMAFELQNEKYILYRNVHEQV